MTSQPTILSHAMAARALADPKFVTVVPELAMLINHAKAAKVEVENRGKGCSGCKKRRIEINLLADLVRSMFTLSPDALRRAKEYFGVSGFMFNMREISTGKIVCKII